MIAKTHTVMMGIHLNANDSRISASTMKLWNPLMIVASMLTSEMRPARK